MSPTLPFGAPRPRHICTRCGKTPEFPDYLTGREQVCMDCWRKADRQKAALRAAEVEATKARHPARYKRRDWLHIAVPFLKSDLGTGAPE